MTFKNYQILSDLVVETSTTKHVVSMTIIGHKAVGNTKTECHPYVVRLTVNTIHAC